jgi:membrane protein implicated in regulation of membrane protease activity
MHLKSKKIPLSVYHRYILLNVPGLMAFILVLILVRQWLAMSEWLFWGLIAGWVAKEAVVLPFVWRAYHRDPSKETATLVGQQGITKKRLAPSGYIQVRGELWKAERIGAGPPVEIGRSVRIHKMEGLTLYVEPDEAVDA